MQSLLYALNSHHLSVDVLGNTPGQHNGLCEDAVLVALILL